MPIPHWAAIFRAQTSRGSKARLQLRKVEIGSNLGETIIKMKSGTFDDDFDDNFGRLHVTYIIIDAASFVLPISGLVFIFW